MRLLILPRYGALGASSRLRMGQYVPYLRQAGVDVELAPLLTDDYVRDLYAGRVSWSFVLHSYWHRFLQTRRLSAYDVVWLEKEAWPWFPSLFELPLLGGKAKLIVDYDDATFHRYDEHRSLLVRSVLGRKIDRVMLRANLVTVGNDYLGERARAAGAKRVEWLPTVIDLHRYQLSESKRPSLGGPLVIGWIGSPSTAPYLKQVSAALAPLQAAGLVHCVAIGARPDQVEGTPFEARSWTEDSEVEQLKKFDIGIMPLPDAPWERGKCGYKLIQYMACGIPVIASPVGVNRSLVKPGVNGFLAQTQEEWSISFRTLLHDELLRRKLGEEGRRQVEESYCVQVQSSRLLKMLNDVISESGDVCVD